MKNRSGIVFIGSLTLLLLFPEQVPGQEAGKRFEYTQVHMGVQARILLYAPDTTTARQAAAAAFDRIAELDQIMSDYRRESELMRLCARAGEGPVRVSHELFDVLRLSKQLSDQSNGAFDVTIGPVVKLWREARTSGRIPATDHLRDAQARVGSRLLKLDEEERTVELVAPGMQLDLGGIAKGFAADAALEALARHGVESALVVFGGDAVAAEAPPGEAGWIVMVPLSDPDDQKTSLQRTAISTSGDTQQFVEIDGIRYSHVVDPRTGLGLTSRVAATVIAPKGALSDALSTTLSVLGPIDGPAFLEEHYPRARAFVRALSNKVPAGANP